MSAFAISTLTLNGCTVRPCALSRSFHFERIPYRQSSNDAISALWAVDQFSSAVVSQRVWPPVRGAPVFLVLVRFPGFCVMFSSFTGGRRVGLMR
jgi:hypothetical protein